MTLDELKTNRLAELQARRPSAREVRINYCGLRQVWDWAIVVGGVAVASGSEKTEADARREAELHNEPVHVDSFVPAKRHLLYHLLPVAGNGTWQRCLDQLRWRLPLFDGRKVIAICTTQTVVGFDGPGSPRSTGWTLDPPAAVEDYLDGTGCEFIYLENSPVLREVASWGKLWLNVAQFANTSDVVFYSHAKGVTQPFNPGTTVHHWHRILTSALLDFYPLIEESLRQHPITGIFKKHGYGFDGSRSAWHYSGSSFWIRCSEAFRHGRWKSIDPAWWGNEAWPGLHWPAHEAGCIFHEGVLPTLNLYEYSYLRDRALPEFRQWCKANAGRRTCWT